MATRLYLPPSSGATGISPAPAAEWENAGSIGRVVPSLIKTNTAPATQQVVDATATANRDVLFKQYVYPLPAGTRFSTLDTIKGRVLVFEAAAANNLRSQCIIRVIASDGTTVRATLYAGDLTTGTSNPTSEWNTSQRNIQMPRGASVACAANYTTVAGDYLVIELGYRKHAAASTTGNMRFLDNNASDLAENETATTDANSWIELTTSFEPASGALFASDTFTGSDGAFINYQSAGTPNSWNSAAGVGNGFKINTNRAYGDTTAYQQSIHNNSPISDEYDVRADALNRGTGVANDIGLSARHNGLGSVSESGYSCYLRRSTGLCELYKISSGAFTLLSSTANAGLVPAVGSITLMELRIRNDMKEVWVGGALILVSTDNAITAANKPGITQGNAAANGSNGFHLDNFAAQDVLSAAAAARYRSTMMVG
jgi:hypothetical protein